MKILLTNDDGYRAQGIQTLFEHLSQHHDVTLIAPDREKSAASHSLSLSQPLRLFPVTLESGDSAYCVNGTPADCVKLALSEIFTTPPDMVVSGINIGSNIGIDIHYSGTVAGAREGALNGMGGIAVSIDHGKFMDFKGMAGVTQHLISLLPSMKLPPGVFLNVNAPPDTKISPAMGMAVTSQFQGHLIRKLVQKKDPRNKDYFWYGQNEPPDGQPGTDAAALKQGLISITPLVCDLTANNAMESVSRVLV